MDATIRALRQRHPGDLAVVYRNFPLTSIHPNALPAAIAAECAGQQGRFDEYASLLFSKQDSLGALSWETLARRARVPDGGAFRQCRAAAVSAGVARDTLVGAHIGITGTPAVVVGGKMAVGAIPIDTLEKWIADARRVASR
jgi:protein-disulfide isomerase